VRHGHLRRGQLDLGELGLELSDLLRAPQRELKRWWVIAVTMRNRACAGS
jgi:hypothetical protein